MNEWNLQFISKKASDYEKTMKRNFVFSYIVAWIFIAKGGYQGYQYFIAWISLFLWMINYDYYCWLLKMKKYFEKKENENGKS